MVFFPTTSKIIFLILQTNCALFWTFISGWYCRIILIALAWFFLQAICKGVFPSYSKRFRQNVVSKKVRIVWYLGLPYFLKGEKWIQSFQFQQHNVMVFHQSYSQLMLFLQVTITLFGTFGSAPCCNKNLAISICS